MDSTSSGFTLALTASHAFCKIRDRCQKIELVTDRMRSFREGNVFVIGHKPQICSNLFTLDPPYESIGMRMVDLPLQVFFVKHIFAVTFPSISVLQNIQRNSNFLVCEH